MYKVLGIIITTMIMQEGPPVNLFSRTIVNYLVSGSAEGIQPRIEDVTDSQIRHDLQKVTCIIQIATR